MSGLDRPYGQTSLMWQIKVTLAKCKSFEFMGIKAHYSVIWPEDYVVILMVAKLVDLVILFPHL